MKRSGKIVVSKSNSSSSLTCSCWHLHAFGNRQRPHIRHIESHTKPCECGLRVPTPLHTALQSRVLGFCVEGHPLQLKEKKLRKSLDPNTGSAFRLAGTHTHTHREGRQAEGHTEGTSADELSRNRGCLAPRWCGVVHALLVRRRPGCIQVLVLDIQEDLQEVALF